LDSHSLLAWQTRHTPASALQTGFPGSAVQWLSFRHSPQMLASVHTLRPAPPWMPQASSPMASGVQATHSVPLHMGSSAEHSLVLLQVCGAGSTHAPWDVHTVRSGSTVMHSAALSHLRHVPSQIGMPGAVHSLCCPHSCTATQVFLVSSHSCPGPQDRSGPQ
jgi:hypothetical protein